MSKNIPSIPAILAATIGILQFFTFSFAQEARIDVDLAANGRLVATIRGKFSSPAEPKTTSEMWFLDDIAGVKDLFRRRSSVAIYDPWGYLIANQVFNGTVRVHGDIIGGFRYSIDLAPLGPASAPAHTSWADASGGVLMLDDLLPQSIGRKSQITLKLPTGWKAFAAESEIAPSVYAVDNVERSVFYIGPKLRSQRVQGGDTPLDLALSGEWLFTDAEAANMAGSIFDSYSRQFGQLTTAPRRVFVGKFPVPTRIGAWEADTRGRSVTILSADMPFKAQSIQRLHEQLRHELFHLWLPNGVNLGGNYDWFYEGFAQYAALKTGVATNQIRFDDMLSTLAQAYNIDRIQPERRSLIEASMLRFSGGNTTVYARGMLVAFLIDITLMRSAKGKASVESLIREICIKYPIDGPRVDGNAAILTIMRNRKELGPVIDRYITGPEAIEWQTDLDAAGIQAIGDAPLTKLSVKSAPTGRQKEILDKLGYNNWRKLTGNLK